VAALGAANSALLEMLAELDSTDRFHIVGDGFGDATAAIALGSDTINEPDRGFRQGDVDPPMHGPPFSERQDTHSDVYIKDEVATRPTRSLAVWPIASSAGSATPRDSSDIVVTMSMPSRFIMAPSLLV
jgi:hypothetical protein